MKRIWMARASKMDRAICPNVHCSKVHGLPQCDPLLPKLVVFVLFLLIPSASLHAASCWPAWNSSTAYNGGSKISYNSVNYQAAYWTQGNNPSTSNGPAGSGQPWIPEGSCSGSGGATPTPTSSGGCTPTAITPYIQVNGGSWQQTSSATVTAGASVTLGPQPVTGGSWSWSGPNGSTSSSRQIVVTINSTSMYTATYTNSGRCKSSQVFTLTVVPTGSAWVTVLDGSEFNSSNSLWANFNNAYPWGSDHNGSARMLQQNVSVSGGALVLTSQKITDNEGNSNEMPFLPIHYHSGTVYWNQQVVVDDTTTQWTIEGDFAVPSVTGTWPAFWLTAVSGWPPELDIIEYKGSATCWQNTFNGIYPKETVVSHKTGVSNPGAYHHYKIWLGKQNSTDILVDYYIDGVWKAEDTATSYMGKPMWLIIDLQMEGSSGSPGPTANQFYYAKNVVIQKLE